MVSSFLLLISGVSMVLRWDVIFVVVVGWFWWFFVSSLKSSLYSLGGMLL